MPITKSSLRRRVLLTAAFAALTLALCAPQAMARYVYTGNYEGDSVSVIDTATNQLVGVPIPVGDGPYTMAITPNGQTLYVGNENSEDLTVVNTQTNQATGSIPIAIEPSTLAISPDGRTGYVTSWADSVVVVVDLQTNQVVGPPISVGKNPWGAAFSPDGKTAYVANEDDNNVSVIDTATRQVVGAPIPVGEEPWGLGLTPDGSRLYVANYADDDVSVIDTAARLVVGNPIPTGNEPYELAVTPNGKTVYVANYETGSAGSVTVIDTATNQPTNVPVGGGPWLVAIVPDQSPVASFTSAASKKLPLRVSFSGAGSSDPDGTIARFDWSFGDGATAINGGPTLIHKYAKAGTYPVSLTAVDNEGCSGMVFTGRTAYCNGTGPAGRSITVKAPNNFKFGKLTRNARKGTAKLQIKLPSPGKLVLSGKKVKQAKRSAKQASKVTLNIRPKGKAKSELATKGSAKVRVKVKFRPTGGKARTKGKTVKLILR